MGTIKPLLSSVSLYLFSLILVISIETMISAYDSSFNELYQVIFIEKLLPSRNYLSITFLILAEFFLWHFACKGRFPGMHLNPFEFFTLMFYILGILIIDAEHQIISIIGFILVTMFPITVGNKLFSDCNATTRTNQATELS